MIRRMWFPTPATQPDWSTAVKALRKSDPVLRKVIDQVGPCTLKPRKDYFVVLCKAIYSQQISTAIAAILFGRFREHFPSKRPTPEKVAQLLCNCEEAVWKKCGLSRQKKEYVLDLARHFSDGRIPTRRLGRMEDEQVIEALTQVKGIGRWTAEMFLMFTLNRPDVLPVDDLGLQDGVKEIYQLKERPKKAQVAEIGEAWRPWRTVATWYIWRRKDGPPSAE